MNFADTKHLTIGGKNAVRLEMGGGVVWKGLPSGYTPLDYIECTGSQYVDLEFVPNQNTRIVCEFMLVENISLSGIYGARKMVAEDDFSFRISANRWQPCYNNEYGTFTDVPVDITQWHIADQNKNVFSFDGVVRKEFAYAEFTAPRPITIGAIKNNASVNYSKCRFRPTQVYDNGVLVRDVMPCIAPDGSIGMYDTVVAKFRGNAGTGEFAYAEITGGDE